MRMKKLSVFIWIIASFSLLGLFACDSELDQARKYAKDKQYPLATKTYEMILKKNPKNKEALFEVTELYCGTRYPNTFKCYGKVKLLYKSLNRDQNV